MAKILRRILCRFGSHKRLDDIQTFDTFGAAHVGCPDCGEQFAINHELRAILPWDADFARMYRSFGYDIEAPLSRWQAHRRALSEV